MPLPKPNSGEEQKDFIARCMGDSTMNNDYSDEKQRSAICYSQWEGKKDLGKGEKYYVESPDYPSVYKPFGGAQSFEEVDEWEAANEQRWNIEKVTYTAQDLMHNVMGDEDVMNKPNKLQKIVDGLRTRLMALMGKAKKDNLDIEMKSAIKEGLDNLEGEKQTTKTEDGVMYRATDYAVVPDKEKPSTWKLRLAEGGSGKFTVQQIARAITAMQPGGFRGQRVELEAGDKKQAIQRINAAISKSDGDDTQKENLRNRLNKVKSYERGAFYIVKNKDGIMRWLGFPSNKWRDRDNPPQIIEEKAHKDFVKHLEKTGEYPVLLGWHTPGTRLGVADFAEYIDGFLVMGGTIDKDKYKEAENLADLCLKEKIGMSHGFVYKYSDEENEVIGWYRAWEVSHLPLSKAANLWTAIDILQKEVKEMPLTDERRAYLDSVYGKDTVDKMLEDINGAGKTLASMGVEFKEVVPENELVIETDQDKVVSEAVKAIVENESFKTMVQGVNNLVTEIKELKETVIPGLQAQIEEVKGTAKQADEKAQKSIDDIVADAFNPRSKGFRPSENAPAPTDADKKKEQTPQSAVDEGLMEMFLNTATTPIAGPPPTQ